MWSARAAQLSLALAAWLWIGALLFLPDLTYPIGSFVCHQRPERSFFFHGHQLAVCARCTGLYLGAAVAAPLAALAALPLESRRARVLLALAALPTALTWGLEFAGILPFSNTSRFVAALPLGGAAAWLVLATFSHRPSPVAPRRSRV